MRSASMPISSIRSTVIPERYDTVAITLHWLIALAMLAEIALGWWMLDIPKLPAGVRAGWFNLHKSIGLTLAFLIAFRLIWRLRHAPPPVPATLPAWQAATARWAHGLMYVCMLVLPISGYIGSTFSGYPIKWFGLALPGWGWKDDAIKDAMSTLHNGVSWLLVALIAAHLAAALKHLLFDRDEVFARMLGSGSWSGGVTVRQRSQERDDVIDLLVI